MKIVHDWLTEYLGEATPTAKAVEELLTFHAFEIDGVEEVKGESVIDVDVLPNRAADCLSHRGIARELATLIDTKLTCDPFAQRPEMPETDKLKVTISDPNACRHFDLALIEGVTVKESPEWLKRRLEALGQRSINNIVDATNYVMFGLGQPTHVYDADKFKKDGDVWHFGVRFAKNGVTVKTLGGQEYEVDDSVQMITNEADDSYAGIAGIKGGAYAELTAETKTIILEAGNFAPTITRKASQKLKLQTDASKRFENGVSTNVIPYAIGELVKLILDIAGGQLVGYAHARPVDINNASVTVSLTAINNRLGLVLTTDEVENIFSRLGFLVSSSESGVWKVTAPFERTDIVIAEDVIEEVGRVYGYDKVVSVVPAAVPLTEVNQRHYYSEVVRDELIGLGFSEVITSSFRKKDKLQLLNALASDKSFMRSALTKNITEVLDKNANFTDLLGIDDIRVFEIGTVFEPSETGIQEHTSLCVGVRLRPSGYSGKEDKVLTEVLAKLEARLGVTLNPVLEKGVAEIDFSTLLARLPDVMAYEAAPPVSAVQYQPFSTYPSVSRDIALWVTEGTKGEDVLTILETPAGEMCIRIRQFDEFTKDGRTSLAFRLVFQSKEKTLTDEEVNAIMDGIYTAVSERQWQVR